MMRIGARTSGRRWAIGVAAAVLTLVSWFAPASAQTPGTTLAVTPSTFGPGSVVRIEGQGVPLVCGSSIGTVMVRFVDGPVVVVVDDTSVDGSFLTSARIPGDAPRGPADVESVCVLDLGPGVEQSMASTRVMVAAPGSRPAAGREGAGASGAPGTGPAPELAFRSTPARRSSLAGGAAASGSPSPDSPTDLVAADPTPTGPDGPAAADASGLDAGTAGSPTASPNPLTDLARLSDLGFEPARFGAAVGLVLAFVFLLGFPATVFNATVLRHYDRITRRLDRVVPGLPAARRALEGSPRLMPLAGFVVAASVVGLFLGDDVGWNRQTAVTFVGLAIGLALTAYLGWLPAVVHANRLNEAGRFRAFPMALYVVIGSVLLSRLVGFDPGYVYGLLFAYHVARNWGPRDDGITFAWGFGVLLGLALVLWVVWLPVHDAVLDGSTAFTTQVADVALAVLVVAGIEGVILGMLPFPFTPGGWVWRWSRRTWLAIYAVALVAFAQVLLRPDVGYVEPRTGVDLFAATAAFVAFAAGSIWFWWYMNFRRPPAPRPVATPTAAELSEREPVGGRG